MQSRLLLICVLFLSVRVFLTSCTGISEKRSHHLTTVEHIANRLKKKDKVQIVDVRNEEEYFHGHIPGSKNLSLSNLRDNSGEIPGLRPSKSEMEELLSQIGIRDHDSVYIYDANGNMEAVRLWWILQSYGFEKAVLIDGGFIQWRAKGMPVQEGMVIGEHGDFRIEANDNNDLLAMKFELIEESYEQIIDARSEQEFNGAMTKNGAVRSGHIPGAIRLEGYELLNGGQFTFKSKETILDIMKNKGLDREKSTVVYSHSGVRSSFICFVLTEIVGMKEVANYDGGWIEWSLEEELPIVTEKSE